MSLSPTARYALIHSFDEIRPSFLAALDQIVAEMRPKMLDIPGFYDESVRACADAFANSELVRYQLLSIQPDILDAVNGDELGDAHLVSVAYLFSLALHELMRNQKMLPGHDD